MHMPEAAQGEQTTRKQIREYFRQVSEQCKLPPLPAVVATALRIIRDPDADTRKLCRVLSDDAALVGRVFNLSRSAFYSRYTPPKTLQQALQVLGLRSVQRVLVAATAQALCRGNSEVSEALWDHSLATAFAAEALARQASFRESEQAFLGGLLHDVGQMVLLHGDPSGFSKIVKQVQTGKEPVAQCEKQVYGFDHTLIGVVLIDCWDLDGEIGSALLNHHDDTVATMEPASLGALLRMADYVSCKAGLGFVTEVLPPAPEALEFWGCGSEEALGGLVERVRQAFDAEKALYS
jgi:putative nucleotidyltransferase with HDIG domain